MPVYREVDHHGIRCHVCGRWFQALATHVIRAHGFTNVNEYRKEFGLSRRGLVSGGLSERLAENARRMGLPKLGEATRIRLIEQSHAALRAPRSPEGIANGRANLIPGYGLEMAHRARRARTHCRSGHAYDSENTAYIRQDGALVRRCRACQRIQKASVRRREAVV